MWRILSGFVGQPGEVSELHSKYAAFIVASPSTGFGYSSVGRPGTGPHYHKMSVYRRSSRPVFCYCQVLRPVPTFGDRILATLHRLDGKTTYTIDNIFEVL